MVNINKKFHVVVFDVELHLGDLPAVGQVRHVDHRVALPPGVYKVTESGRQNSPVFLKKKKKIQKPKLN